MASHKLRIKYSLPLLLSIILICLLIVTFEVIFQDKFFPGIYIGDTSLTFLTKAEALQVLSAKFQPRLKNLQFNYENANFEIDLTEANTRIDSTTALDKAFRLGHDGALTEKIVGQLMAFTRRPTFSPDISLSLDPQIQSIYDTTYAPPKNAVLTSDLNIQPDKPGVALDKDALILAIKDYLTFGRGIQSLPIKQADPEVTTQKVTNAKNYLTTLDQDPIKLTFEDNTWALDTATLLPLLNLKQGALIDNDKLKNYLSDISVKINQPLKEAQFSFDPASSRVSAFQPAQEGRELDIDKTTQLIELAFEGIRPKSISLPVNTVEPKIQTSDVNNLGIKELIGEGVSNFAGSIPNRIYNVGLTASKINGVLIPPGGIFSFNQTVGDITAATGFRKAYVIKEGRTVLDDGGGVCQDSTTLFRAVLNAGLPVIARTAHAYRVGYYEQGFPPGLDATVFYPSVDFQFKNDTGAHILIQAHTEGLTLYVDLYGTSDGRVATLSTPVVTNQTPPPPELRQDDPTLPKGTVKQVDFPAWGADVSFKRVVRRLGETVNETWKSNYKPWQAVYLVGTE